MKFSILNFEDVKKDNPLFRFDADYFRPDYLEAEKAILRIKHTRFGEIMQTLTDYHANGSYEILRRHVELLDRPDYALMVRTVDFERDDFEKDVKFISKHAYEFLRKTQVSSGEIIINKIGNAGQVYLMPNLNRPVSLGMNQFMIRIDSRFKPNYICIFLKSKYGEKIINKRITGAVPVSIDKESVRSIWIPILDDIQNLVDSTVIKAQESHKVARILYFEAEQFLLSKLGLTAWKPKFYLSFIKNFSDFKSANRVDAEYFQPMYEEVVRAIKSSNFAYLGDVASIKKCTEPGSEVYQENGIPFVRVSNLSKFGIDIDNQQFISEEVYEKLLQHQPKRGEILLSKDATPGIAFYLADEPKKMIPSGGILRLTVKNKGELLPEYLTLVLNSTLIQKQIERDAGGSIINHWRVDQAKNTLIPILPIAKQKQITEKIEISFKNRDVSKFLLNIAKRGVELAIEKNEKDAENWIKSQLKEI